MKRRLLAGLAVAAAVAAACTPSGQVGNRAVPEVSPAGRPFTYVAIGASESFGTGAEIPQRDAWPQVFYRDALPRAATLVDLGIPGATVGNALLLELPRERALHPALVTVWLNVNDLTHGVSLLLYRHQLTRLLRALRDGGRTEVLVANTPPLDRLPRLLECQPFAPVENGCSRSILLPLGRVRRLVAQFNDAIAEVAHATGAVVVDLHSWGERIRTPEEVRRFTGSDGFHPSSAGYRSIAAVFAHAYRKAGAID